MERVLNPEADGGGSCRGQCCFAELSFKSVLYLRLLRTLQFDVVVCKWRLCNLTFLMSSRSHTGMQRISGISFPASLSSSF